MRRAILTRNEFSDEGTFGTLLTDSGFTCDTGELPWRDNQPNRSCIPPGVYNCNFRMSSKPNIGECYHVDGVTDRTGIEIHAANFMGDIYKNFKCELEGCIAPGMGIANLDGKQRQMVSSRLALSGLESDLNGEDFELKIE